MTTLELGEYYHIFNRGNNHENLFREERNYSYFLKLYQKYVLPVAETFAYCLLKNHFHVLLRIRTVEEQRTLKDLTGLPLKPHQQFSNLFNSYTKSINKAYQRSGNLFHRPFQRLRVDTDSYFIRLVHYIHFNPQKHGFVKDFREYPHSSYRTIVSERSTKLMRDSVLQAFSGKTQFLEIHSQRPDEKKLCDVMIEL